MTPALWQRLKPLFDEALSLANDDRAAFIEKACQGDAKLKENLIRLVEAAEERTRTLAGPIAQFASNHRYRFRKDETILNRFRIVRPLGRGGMGEVYEAEDLELGRVALKTIRDDIAVSPSAFQRFRKEVQLARKVTGAQVCRIHELYLLPATPGRSATAFLSMEYLDGVTLADRLHQSGPMAPKQALRVALDICEGLRLVHAQGIIHRDLKSVNIMLCGEGESQRSVLMDFGLAHDFSHDAAPREGGEDSTDVAQTQPGAIMGTPAYMAPEQFEGKPVSPQTDIYALGVVLYELVTALHPFAAPTPVGAAIRRARHPLPPSSMDHAVPRSWDRVIDRCLAYEPADRFSSAAAVAKTLRPGATAIRSLPLDRPWLSAVAGALIVALAAWGIVSWWRNSHYYHPRRDVKTLYDDGIKEIRDGEYVLARNSFQEAVNRDRQFAMAHARLAEALYELGLQDDAQKELLRALPGRDGVAPLDGLYLDAIDAKVTEQPLVALNTYTEILKHLRESEKSPGYVDLGRAYERSEDTGHALENYEQAIKEDEDNPEAYIRAGVLHSRSYERSKAAGAFARAGEIYQRKGTSDGLVELKYEEAYEANVDGDPDAQKLLTETRQAAEEVHNVPLQVRTLALLSSGARESAQAEAYAKKAMDLALDAHLDRSWVISTWVRLASAELAMGRPVQAEEPLKHAMALLTDNSEPRASALANGTLASIKLQEGRFDAAIQPAQAALDYYKKNGFFEPAAKAKLILARIAAATGHFEEALASSQELVALADKSKMVELQIQAKEIEGMAYLIHEHYPKALVDFESAKGFADLDRSSNADTLRSYEAAFCGDLQWRLNHVADSQPMLDLASKEQSLTANVAASRAEAALSQLQFRPALALVQKAIEAMRDENPEAKWELEQDELLAESYLGMKREALAGLKSYSPPPEHRQNPQAKAKDQMIEAEVFLAVGRYQDALAEASSAEAFFSTHGLLDSDLRSALIAERAAGHLRNASASGLFAKKVIDIRTRLEQNWGPDPFQQYISRPDLKFLSSAPPRTSP